MTFREAGAECLKKCGGSDESAKVFYDKTFQTAPESERFYNLEIPDGHENACILAMLVMNHTKRGHKCYDLAVSLLDELETKAVIKLN